MITGYLINFNNKNMVTSTKCINNYFDPNVKTITTLSNIHGVNI
ncbi:hypothetical protein [Candidatus Hodgkinia cicadicola]